MIARAGAGRTMMAVQDVSDTTRAWDRWCHLVVNRVLRLRNRHDLDEVYSTVWRLFELREDRRSLPRSLLRYARITSVVWSVLWLLMVGATLTYAPTIDLASMLRTGIVSVSTTFLMAGIAEGLRRGAERHARHRDAIIENLGAQHLTVELLRQLRSDQERDELMGGLDENDPVRFGRLDDLTRIRVALRAAVLSWWEERLEELTAAERETAVALFADFNGTATELLSAAKRL